MKELEVVAAIMLYNGKILCAQRDKSKYEYISYKFEFPGGKVEKDEDCFQALIRELNEEMDVNLDINNMKHYCTVEHKYPDFKVKMHAYLCNVDSDYVLLKEHKKAIWLEKIHLETVDWAEADIPIVVKIVSDENFVI